MIIDFHAHIYPNKIADKAVHNVASFYNIDVCCDGTAESLLEIGQRAGIDKFLVHSVAQTPGQVRSINNFISSQCEAHPNNFIGFGTLHPDMAGFEDEIGHILALGLKGVKLHPDVQGFYVDSRKMMDIFSMLEGRLPVLVHAGDYRYAYSHPERIARVLGNFPKLMLIAAHFGGWSLPDLALEYLENKSCYLDVSSSIMYLGKKRAVELIRAYGAGRILFGSDFPMWDPRLELERFNSLGLSGGERELILSGNALKILG